jgi:hypothetical protein
MRKLAISMVLLAAMLFSTNVGAFAEDKESQNNSKFSDSGIRSLGFPTFGHSYESGALNGNPFVSKDNTDVDSKYWGSNLGTKALAAIGSAASSPITCHNAAGTTCQVYTGDIALIPVFVGTWNPANQTQWNNVLGNLVSTLNAGSINTVNHVFNTNSLYFSLKSTATPTLSWYSNSFVTAPSATNVSDAQVGTYINNFISTNSTWIASNVPSAKKKIYVYIGGSATRLSSGFGTAYCGWHTYGTFSGTQTPFIAIQDFTSKYLPACAAQTVSPNGNAYLDAMASVLVHEIDEAITDPFLNAYYDSRGAENADKCAWTFGTTTKVGTGASSYIYNWTGGSYKYLIQQNWLANNLVTALGAAKGTACTITA